MRIIIAGGTALIWCAVILFDPQTMERPGSPVDGLVAAFLAWMVVGAMGGLSLLPFVWRRPKDWSHVVVAASVASTAAIALFHVVASLRHVPYRRIEPLSSASVCLQGLAIFGCAAALIRVITLQPTSET